MQAIRHSDPKSGLTSIASLYLSIALSNCPVRKYSSPYESNGLASPGKAFEYFFKDKTAQGKLDFKPKEEE